MHTKGFGSMAVFALCLLMQSPLSQAGLRQALAERRAASTAAIQLPEGAQLQGDLAYGSDPRQRLDAYLPPSAGSAPVIVMVHGGGWRHGDKRDAQVVQAKIDRWLPRGVLFVSANYRMLPTQDALLQADDVARAIAYVQAHAKDWGGDPQRVVLMGHSAGAHLVSLVNADPAFYARFGMQPVLGAVSLDAGAIDVVSRMEGRRLPMYDAAFGDDPRRWQQASPTARVSPQAAPLLAVCSSVRKDDPCGEAQNYAHAAATQGARALRLPQRLTHFEINRDLGRPGSYTDAVEDFLASLDEGLAQRLKD